jgi:hypothetical protein
MIVEIRPRTLDKWHGKKGDEDFTRPVVIVPAIDPATMQYQVEFTADERKFLEKTNYDISLDASPERPHPTWDGPLGQVKLENNTMLFNTGVPTELLKVGIIRGAKNHVAPSLEDAENIYPNTTHYIFDEDVTLADKVSKITIKQEANKLLYEMLPEDIAQIVYLATTMPTKNKSANLIRAKADELVEKDPAEFLRWARMPKEDVSLLSLVEEGIEDGILTKDGPRVMFGGDVIGFSTLEAAEYLKKKENQPLYLKIAGTLKKKK